MKRVYSLYYQCCNEQNLEKVDKRYFQNLDKLSKALYGNSPKVESEKTTSESEKQLSAKTLNLGLQTPQKAEQTDDNKAVETNEIGSSRVVLQEDGESKDNNLTYMLNYVRYLIDNKQYKKALHQLDFVLYEKPNYSVLKELYPLYFECCYEQKAEKIDKKYYQTLDGIEKVLASKYENILNEKSPNKDKEQPFVSTLNFGIEALKDIQPMKAISTKVSAQIPKSNLLNLSVNSFTDTFYTDGKSNSTIWRWYAKNTFSFWKPNLNITLGAGWADKTKQKGSHMLDIDVVKRVKSILSFNAGFNRQPYMGTVASAFNELVMQNNLYFNVEHKYRDKYIVSFQSQRSSYGDGNKILSLGGWGLVKVPTFSKMSLHLGYGFSYSDADEIKYVPDVEYDDLLNVYEVGGEVGGVYDPYFTPNKQKIHLGIASVGFDITKRLNINATLKYALNATTQAPLLYMYQNEEGYPYTLIFYYKAKYTPYDASIKLDYKVTDRWKLNMFYQQNETFYYQENRAGISTTINF